LIGARRVRRATALRWHLERETGDECATGAGPLAAPPGTGVMDRWTGSVGDRPAGRAAGASRGCRAAGAGTAAYPDPALVVRHRAHGHAGGRDRIARAGDDPRHGQRLHNLLAHVAVWHAVRHGLGCAVAGSGGIVAA